jgi:hypothetical protein
MAKLFGHPGIDTAAGLNKLRSRVMKTIPVSRSSVIELLSVRKFNICQTYADSSEFKCSLE